MRNLLTKNINSFQIINTNQNLLVTSHKIRENLITALKDKDILVSDLTISKINNNFFITVKTFIKTFKILKYKKLLKKGKNKEKLKKKQYVKNLFLNNFRNILKRNNIVFKLVNLNQQIDNNQLELNYKEFQRFNNLIFNRGFHLFLDFIKTLALIQKEKINLKPFLIILGQIFKGLNKRKHSKFVFFIKTIFQSLIASKHILGAKFIINGRVMGKTRANTIKIREGALSTNTINSNYLYDQIHVYTLYGAFGFKLWIKYS